MAQMAEIYIEMLSLASLLLNQMGQELGVPQWTVTCRDLVNSTQLGWQGRDSAIFVNSLYVSQHYYQELVKEWGPPPADSGPPGLVYCGENIRLNEAGGAEFLQAIVDILHLVFVKCGSKPKFQMHGPASQSIAIRLFVRGYCAECNYKPELVNQITCMPYFEDKTEMLRWQHAHPEMTPVAGEPVNPHTGCVDPAVVGKPTLNWTPPNSEWHAKVSSNLNTSMGCGDVLNTTTREQFTNTGVMILSGELPYRAMVEHSYREMEAGNGLYCTDQLGQALWSTVPFLLSLARSGSPAEDVDTTRFYTPRPPRLFAFPWQRPENAVDDSKAMKVQTILQIMICKGCFLQGCSDAAATALGEALIYMSLDPSTVRRGGARVTVQGIVNYPGDQKIASKIAWRDNWRATVKLDYPRTGDPVCTSATLHNSENVRESQALIFIDSERKLERAGRMKQMVRKLIPLLGWGKGAVGFVKTDKTVTTKAYGVLIFLFCEAIPDGNDLHESKIVQDVRDAWRERGEIGENARALARGLLHVGSWMNREVGWVQMDGSWGNIYPYSLSPVTDQKVAEQMPEPAGVGFCDFGGCMHIGTLSERKDKQARATSKSNPTSLMRNATQTDPPTSAKRPRLPSADSNGVGILTDAKLRELAEHRRKHAIGNGRPTGGTPACTDTNLKRLFDDARQDELLAVDLAILWQSFTAGVIILSLFCPMLKTQTSADYIKERELAAQSQADMLSFMARHVREGVEIKQPETAAWFANLIWNLTKQDLEKRKTDEQALKHPALTHIIFTKDVLDAVQGDGYLIPGRNGPAGSGLEHLTSKAWLLKPDGPNGSWGTGAFAAQDIRARELAGWYAAIAHDMSSSVSLGEYPPGFAKLQCQRDNFRRHRARNDSHW